jgi:small multidrug resistance pump
MKNWLLLALAIVSEVIATSALKYSDGFKHIIPSIIVATGYCIAFYCLSIALRVIPVAVAYAVWSGAGILCITVIGFIAFRQKPDIPALIGIALILAGVLVINIFSKNITR